LPARVIGALLKAEIVAKQARSINYQMRVAKLPVVKELADLVVEGTLISGELINQFATGAFLEDKRAAASARGARLASSTLSTSPTSWKWRANSVTPDAPPMP
jgi:hypothetical protein